MQKEFPLVNQMLALCTYILVTVVKEGGELECLCFTNLTEPPVKSHKSTCENSSLIIYIHTNISEISLQYNTAKTLF